MSGIVSLVSGGLDSSVMASLIKEEGQRQYPLFVDYGQLSRDIEWQSCQVVLPNLGIGSPVRMGLSGFGKIVRSGLTAGELRVNEDAFTPCRNLLFLLAGAAYAHQMGCGAVAIGLLNQDYRLFPDQSEDFIRSAEATLALALGHRVAVIAPLMALNKADVVELARARGIAGTRSCHAGSKEPCGHCVACMEYVKSGLEV